MHERAGAQEQRHLDNPMEQHVGHTGEQSFRGQEHYAKEHIRKIAYCRVGQSPLKMALLEGHCCGKNKRKG